jgi:hypothetical protein
MDTVASILSRSKRLSIDLTQIGSLRARTNTPFFRKIFLKCAHPLVARSTDGLKAGGLSRLGDDMDLPRPAGSAAVSAAHAATADALDSVAPDAPKIKAMFATFSPDVLAAYGVIVSFVRE